MKYLILLMAFFITTAPLQAQDDKALGPYGLWLTENQRSAIQVEDCDGKLCGRIAWIIDGGMQYDTKNPKESLRGQAMCGLLIMKDLEQDQRDINEWEDGHIYKADDGDIYRAKLEVMSAEKMVVRGYKGISLLGKSQTWTRVSTQDYPPCRKPN